MKSTADVYEAAARVMRMARETGLSWREGMRYDGLRIAATDRDLDGNPEHYSAAVTTIQGRFAFVGDVAYLPSGEKYVIGQDAPVPPTVKLTWEPPRRTVTVNGKGLPMPINPYRTRGSTSCVVLYFTSNEDARAWSETLNAPPQD